MGVKANDNLLLDDWKSPINFALGFCYASSGKNVLLKEKIEYFLGNTLIGHSINDIIKNYEHYAYETEEDAYTAIEKIIDELQKILEN